VFRILVDQKFGNPWIAHLTHIHMDIGQPQLSCLSNGADIDDILFVPIDINLHP